ncbi:MAG: hypothetical protein QXN66_04460 [Thermoplasmatales archaeon]
MATPDIFADKRTKRFSQNLLCINKKNIIRGYTEFVKAPARFVYKINKKADIRKAAFAEPLSAVVHVVRSINSHNLIIVGTGPMD